MRNSDKDMARRMPCSTPTKTTTTVVVTASANSPGLSRRMTLAWGLVLMGFGFVKWGPLLEAGLTVAALPLGSLLGLFLLGTLDRRANAMGAVIGMFVGLTTILCVLRFTGVAFTWYVMIGSCVTFAVGAVVSRMIGEKRIVA